MSPVPQSAALVNMETLLGARAPMYFPEWLDALRDAAASNKTDRVYDLLCRSPSAKPSADENPVNEIDFAAIIASRLASALAACREDAYAKDGGARLLLNVGSPRWEIGETNVGTKANRSRVANVLSISGAANPTECFVGGRRFPIANKATLLSSILKKSHTFESAVTVAKDILTVGADINENDCVALAGYLANETALDRPSELIAFLLDSGADVTLCHADIARHIGRLPTDAVKMLFEVGFDPAADGSKALVYAARASATKGLIPLLLREGCDPNAHGGAPLFAAISRGHSDNVLELLRAGADPARRFDATTLAFDQVALPTVQPANQQTQWALAATLFWWDSFRVSLPLMLGFPTGIDQAGVKQSDVDRALLGHAPAELAEKIGLSDVSAMIASAGTDRQLRATPPLSIAAGEPPAPAAPPNRASNGARL